MPNPAEPALSSRAAGWLCAVLIGVLTLSPLRAVADTSEPVGVWPTADHAVVHAFDPPAQAWTAGHRGVDLAGSIGDPVVSALAGRVSFRGAIAGVPMVVVDHGDTRTTYQPVQTNLRVGEMVAAGDLLGHLSWFGTHCLPRACLHWGWLRGPTYLDPLDLVGGGPQPIRLYPIGTIKPASALLLAARLSGTWMSLLVGLAQPFGGDVGVDLRRRQ